MASRSDSGPERQGLREEPVEIMQRLRRLVELMSENDLTELEVEESGVRIRIHKNQPLHYIPAALDNLQRHLPAPGQPALEGSAQLPVQVPAAKHGKELVEISSPMVGTFYRAGTPGGEPCVSAGSVVEPDTVVCIVEAMKVMNEIKAEQSGEITEVLAHDAEPVEFGQVLFLVRPLAGQ